MKLQLTITFIFLGILTSISQNQERSLHGTILYRNAPIADVTIYNLSTKLGTISNKNGEFSIIIHPKDTLSISHIEYINRKIIVTKEIRQQASIILHLEIKTNYLDTVEIKNHTLSGSLFTDAESISKDSLLKAARYINEIIKISKHSSKNTEVYNRSASYVNDVDPIKMNGAGASVRIPIPDKENELRRELRRKKSTPEKIIIDFGENYFIETLHIPKDKIFNFLTYCEFKGIFKFYNNGEYIKVIDILTTESKSFNKWHPRNK